MYCTSYNPLIHSATLERQNSGEMPKKQFSGFCKLLAVNVTKPQPSSRSYKYQHGMAILHMYCSCCLEAIIGLKVPL